MSSDIAISLASALAALPADKPFVELFRREGEISVELYVPQGADRQTPHTRDELYIIAEGTGTFRREAETVTFGPGDLLYVPAHVDHRFETFSPDFKVWVIFYGPDR